MLAVLLALAGLCGSERWAVKTMTDRDAHAVQLAPVRSSIAELAALPRPSSERGRRRPVERRVVTLDGYVVQVRNEDDGDRHVVIADDSGYTMIIEFPAPACMQGSGVLRQAATARKTLLRLIANDPVHGDLKIRVTGVVFFDRYHRQSGVASNAVELHPVLGVEALEGPGRAQTPPLAAAQVAPADEGTKDEAVGRPSVSHPPAGGCCKVCRTSQSCGDSCIPLMYTCHKPAGCACSGR